MIETINYLISLFRQGFPCLFQLITGLYCPGCGGTRASVYLMRGKLLESLHYHPLVAYLAVVILLELGSWAASKVFHKPELHVKRYVMFAYIGAAIVLLNWGWKNYYLAVRGIDLLP